jgi:hypothetical protein
MRAIFRAAHNFWEPLYVEGGGSKEGQYWEIEGPIATLRMWS